MHKKLSFTLNNEKLSIVDDAKFLGITFYSKGTFKKHSEEVFKANHKTYFSLLSIKGTKYGPSPKIMLQLFKTFTGRLGIITNRLYQACIQFFDIRK